MEKIIERQGCLTIFLVTMIIVTLDLGLMRSGLHIFEILMLFWALSTGGTG